MSQYTNRQNSEGWAVPDVLRSGHHKILLPGDKGSLKADTIIAARFIGTTFNKEEVKLLKEIIAEESEKNTGEV